MINKKNGIEYEFIKGGSNSKINLVFVHGSGGNKTFLSGLADQVKEYNLYLIDLPGHGGSDDTGYSMDNYLNSVANFVKDLNDVILIGHSLGGTIALAVSSKNIQTVKGTVLISSFVSMPKLDKDFMVKIHDNIVDMERLLQFAGQSTDPLVLEALNGMTPELLIKDFIIDEIVDVSSCLTNINVPTTIAVGGDEILALVEYSEYIHENVKNSKLTIIPNERHLLPLTKRFEIGKLIKDLVLSINL